MKLEPPLTRIQVDEFRENGLLVVRGFYDLENAIRPIQRSIHRIIGLLIAKYRLPIEQVPFTPDTFDSGYQELIAHHRHHGSEVYDAVKQIPAFLRLVVDPRHDSLLCQLRGSDIPGVAAGGYGIRIDNPSEEKYRASLHQDYTGQLRSLDGLVFWSSLIAIDETLGPVEFCLGSHRAGVFKVQSTDRRHPEKTGAYAQVLQREEELLARYPRVAPLTGPGDLILVDFLTLHQSGFNRANRSRWSMQMRYFNFEEPTGIRIGWCGSFSAGVDIRQIHPELFSDGEEERDGGL